MKKKKVTKYEFAVKDLYKNLSAEDAAKELDRIKEKYGSVTPENVLEESEDTSSVLHGIFCWDDTTAAKNYRLIQAKKLIANIKIIIINEKVEVPIRAYVNVRKESGAYRTYEPIHEVIHNDVAYKDLLLQSKAEMNSFVVKYSQIEELNAVKAEMLKAINLID